MSRRDAGLAGIRVRPLPDPPRRSDGRIDLDRVAAGLSLRLGAPAPLLESVPGTPRPGRWSYVVAGISGRMRQAADGGWTGHGTLADVVGQVGDDDALTVVDRVCEQLGLTPDAETDSALPPCSGGLIGAFSYDLVRQIESLPALARRDRPTGTLDLVAADVLVAIDHDDESALLLQRGRRAVDLAGLEAAIATAPALPPLAPAPQGARAETSLPRADYLQAVDRILEHIAAGDAFQVNLTQRITAHHAGGVHSLYRRLRAASAAAYGAVVWDGADGGLASISPETFLQASGRRVRTRPIKGTRPRSSQPATDAAARDELTASAKDRAENVMVVDMERNDLGRVCVPGSVRVPGLLEIEGHPTVWHLVSTVEGELRGDVGWGQLLRATFPCGSVTGTPKVRAMQLIDGLEPVRRGWYCGAIGFLSAGAMSTSVAIRTATLGPDGRVDYGAGGGIVADSDPAAEWEESLAKAAAFLAAVGAQPPQ